MTRQSVPSSHPNDSTAIAALHVPGQVKSQFLNLPMTWDDDSSTNSPVYPAQHSSRSGWRRVLCGRFRAETPHRAGPELAMSKRGVY